MKKKRLYILAPNDRFNYGDLIFSHIITFYFKPYVDDIVYCSTTESNLTELGGHKTHSFKVLHLVDPLLENYLIIAGGECLFASWSIISYVDTFINKVSGILYKYRFLRMRDIVNVLSCLAKLKYRPRTRYPFTIGKFEVPRFKGLYYNSVGGSYLKKRYKFLNQKDIRIIKDCDYLSVRDTDTKEGLYKLGVNCNIVADSAILMSEAFSDVFLISKVRPSILRETNSHYIFFQTNLKLWNKNKEEMTRQLKTLMKENNGKICLCPIGTALGHSDQVALSEIYSILGTQNTFFIDIPNIWEIMFLIKNSKLYIGSSLHGVITAMSFNVPFLTFGVEKVKAYIRRWISEKADAHVSDIDKISLNAKVALHSNYSTDNQISSIKESFGVIINHIQND